VRENFRCFYLQQAVSGPNTVNVFENKSDNIEKTHVTAMKTSAITTARNMKCKNTK